jgi:RNA polymerase sigma factor for flagellar operon FliA
MTPAETQLWENYKRTQSDADRNALVVRYESLAGRIANMVMKTVPRCADADDMYQAGIIGLIDAIPRFDPSRGLSPSTFLSMRIRGAMLDHQRDLDPVPRLTRGRERKYSRAVMTLKQQLGRPPTDEEIREQLKLTERDYRKVKADATSIPDQHSLSGTAYAPETSYGRATNVVDTITDDRTVDPAIRVERAELCQHLLSLLPPGFSMLIVHYYMMDETMNEIAQRLGKSESRISQIMSNVRMQMASLALVGRAAA